MSEEPPTVLAARAEVKAARERIIATLGELQRQFEPHRLMQEVWEKTKDKGADLAENAVDAVSRRPVAAGAVVAGIVAFLARDSLMSAAGKLIGGAKAKSKKRRKAPAKEAQTEAAE